MSQSILIIGKPSTSKSSFLGQLYTLIESEQGQIRLWKTPDDLSAVQSIARRHAEGKEAEATPPTANHELVLPLQIGQQFIELHYPDYGGEQIEQMLHNRLISEPWLTLVNQSDDWLLFIRPLLLYAPYDLTTKPASEANPDQPTVVTTNPRFSDQTELIELLQMFLAVRQQSIRQLVRLPRLSVVLTCWDELDLVDRKPLTYLQRRMPLLVQYIAATWAVDAWQCVGLSAQGFSLQDPDNQNKYRSNGPEKYPYVVNASGAEVHDLTNLLTFPMP